MPVVDGRDFHHGAPWDEARWNLVAAAEDDGATPAYGDGGGAVAAAAAGA